MVEESTQCDALAHHIVGREVDTQSPCSTGCLSGVDVNLANERRVVVELQVEVENSILNEVARRCVVAYMSLT